MRTNIDIDDDLMAEAQRASGLTSKKATVEHALHALIAREAQSSILALAGKVEFDDRVIEDRAEHGLD